MFNKMSPKAMSTEIESEKPISDKKCPKIVPLDEYRQKKRA
jgi:hypothetical protein